jgi:hypothetical protein
VLVVIDRKVIVNKLIIALNVVIAKKWIKQLMGDQVEAFNYLLENSKDLTDDELSPTDLEVVAIVDKLLEEHSVDHGN